MYEENESTCFWFELYVCEFMYVFMKGTRERGRRLGSCKSTWPAGRTGLDRPLRPCVCDSRIFALFFCRLREAGFYDLKILLALSTRAGSGVDGKDE